MIANGLTKALNKKKRDTFLDQLRLISTEIYHTTYQLREITIEEWDALEDSLDGGESDQWMEPRS